MAVKALFWGFIEQEIWKIEEIVENSFRAREKFLKNHIFRKQTIDFGIL